MSFFSGAHRARTRSLFNNNTQLSAVDRWARNSSIVSSRVRRPFTDANRSIVGAERLYKTQPGKSGIKDTYMELDYKNRIVGRDAMIRAREAKRENEENPLMRSVQTKPVAFSRRDVNLIQRESKKLGEDVKRYTFQGSLPIATTAVENVGNTLPKHKTAMTEFKEPKNYSELDMVIDEKKKTDDVVSVPSGKKRKSVNQGPNVTAPPLSKRAKETVNLDTLVARTTADMYARQSM